MRIKEIVRPIFAAILLFAVMIGFTSCREKDEFVFEINDDGTAVLAEYHGEGGHVQVPDSYEGMPVAEIGSFAFGHKLSVTSVTLPETVKKIDKYAFVGAAAITSVDVNGGAVTIGEGAFSGCRGLEKIELTISGELPKWAFKSCTSLKSAEIEGATSIGFGAFSGCISLHSFSVPGDTKEIYAKAFEGCVSLGKVSVGEQVEKIGRRCFGNTAAEISFRAPSSYTKVESETFSDCYGASIYLPSTITHISSRSFAGCTAEIVFDSKMNIEPRRECFRSIKAGS